MSYKELLPMKNKDIVVFNSPIEGSSNIVRIGNNFSLLEAILNVAVPEEEYKNKDDMEKVFYIENMKKKMMNNKVIEMNMEKNQDFIDNFKKNVYNIFYIFYDFMEVSDDVKIPFEDSNSKKYHDLGKNIVKKFVKDEKDVFEYDLMCQTVTLKSLFEVLNNFFDSLTEYIQLKILKKNLLKTINSFLNNLEILKQIPVEKAEYLQKNYNKFVTEVINDSEFEVYKSRLSIIKTIDKNINSEILKLIEDHFDLNILFLDSKSRKSKEDHLNTGEKNKDNSILILCFELSNGMYKYETVGKIVKKNKIQYVFSNTDPLIINYYEKEEKEKEPNEKETDIQSEIDKICQEDDSDSESETESTPKIGDVDAVVDNLIEQKE